MVKVGSYSDITKRSDEKMLYLTFINSCESCLTFLGFSGLLFVLGGVVFTEVGIILL